MKLKEVVSLKKKKDVRLKFKGGLKTAFLSIAIFLGFCILFLVVLKAFEMHALAMGALVALLISALFVADGYENKYWEDVYDGVSESVPIVVLLLIIGMFSEMIKVSNIAYGFVWIAEQLSVSGGLYTGLTFIFVAIIATATGSSIGTFFTSFPIFYASGILMGSHPAALAGAIISGGIFGDNLAPISDTTIISASTQKYQNKPGTAEVGACVSSRLPYSLIAGALSFIAFVIFGGGGNKQSDLVQAMTLEKGPKSLIMLLAVGVMLFIAINKQNMYLAITISLIVGTVLGLLTNILTPTDVLNVTEGMPGGYLVNGVESMMGTVLLVMSVYGIMGILNHAGILDQLIESIFNSPLGETAKGAEIAMMIGITITTWLFGGVTSASMATFGKIQDELGKRVNLHPTRRANLLDGFANGLGVAIPFLSVFIFIGSQLTNGYDFVDPVSAVDVSKYLYHSYFLFIVFFISVLTGWGRKFEGLNGEALSSTEYDKLFGQKV